MSWGWPMRRTGTEPTMCLMRSGSLALLNSSVAIGPGPITFTVLPHGPGTPMVQNVLPTRWPADADQPSTSICHRAVGRKEKLDEEAQAHDPSRKVNP